MTVRLDDLKEQYGDKIHVEWKSFMLRPTEQGAKSRAEFVEYSRPWSRMPDADPRLVVTSPWASATHDQARAGLTNAP